MTSMACNHWKYFLLTYGNTYSLLNIIQNPFYYLTRHLSSSIKYIIPNICIYKKKSCKLLYKIIVFRWNKDLDSLL